MFIMARHTTRVCTLVLVLAYSTVTQTLGDDGDAKHRTLYFPPSSGTWEKVEPSSVGWDKAKLDAALEWAGEVGSSSVVVLHGGKILVERHWDPKAKATLPNGRPNRYFGTIAGKNAQGHVIEDVASVQKTLVSILVGMAQEKGLLKIDDPVSKHLGVGWSDARVDQEQRITIRHLITMTSGLTDELEYAAKAGSVWKYNTAAYAKSRDCVVAVSGKEVNELTRLWITEPLGMQDSKWVPRKRNVQAINPYGFGTTARDLARFGLMMQANGKWGDRTIIADQRYLKEATHPSQELNKSYGYLWWLNSSRRIRSAPSDTYSANGALTRRLYVVPSLNLVVTRLGDNPKMKNARNFDSEFCRRLLAAKP